MQLHLCSYQDLDPQPWKRQRSDKSPPQQLYPSLCAVTLPYISLPLVPQLLTEFWGGWGWGWGQSGHFVDYLISHPKVKDHWRDYTNHEFVNQLGAGTLDKESFKYYLMQDYLFLVRISLSPPAPTPSKVQVNPVLDPIRPCQFARWIQK